MRKITLKPKAYYTRTTLKVSFISVRWDEKNKVLETLLSLAHYEHDNTKTAGMKLFSRNVETMERMLLDHIRLYPVKWEMEVLIPDPGEPGYISVFDKGVRIVGRFWERRPQ